MTESKKFEPGKDRVLYAQPVFGNEEMQAVAAALAKGWLGHGQLVSDFEKQVAELFGKQYGLFVNSGTSANTIAMEVAGVPIGSEVITQACTFPATLMPIVQQGYVPVFVDSKIGTYNADLDVLEKAIGPNTRAIFLSHLIGNVNDMRRLHKIATEHNLVLIEDSCDTIGSKFGGRATGEYSDIVTASFYAAHNMTAAGGGGMVMVDDPVRLNEAQMLNDWGRALPSTDDDNIAERFNTKLDDTDFDAKFTYVRRTYNFKGVEIMAAFGLEQLKKLDSFNAIRAGNIQKLQNYFKNHEEHFILPEVHPEADSYLLAFPLTVRSGSSINRKHLMTYLEEHNIQTRPLFAGNIMRHPAFKDIKSRVHGDLKNADFIMKNSFLTGCHHGLTDEHLDYVFDTYDNFLKEL
jgi:CDP-4-dehydro-6-deoxyglucose reductase, E1